jgi:hypothetical protein
MKRRKKSRRRRVEELRRIRRIAGGREGGRVYEFEYEYEGDEEVLAPRMTTHLEL